MAVDSFLREGKEVKTPFGETSVMGTPGGSFMPYILDPELQDYCFQV